MFDFVLKIATFVCEVNLGCESLGEIMLSSKMSEICFFWVEGSGRRVAATFGVGFDDREGGFRSE